MASRHSVAPRGLKATRSSLSQGRFGRMFRNLTPAVFGPTEADNIANLSALATARTRMDVDRVLAPLESAYASLRSASNELPGFEIMAFEHGCCAPPKRTT